MKCTTAVNLFLAHRYAAVLIILLVRTDPDPRPVWCNAPLPLCNQAQTRWLKVLLQLPERRSHTLISATIHMVYKPLWAPQTRPQNNQASYFFPTIKIPQVQHLLIDVNWIFFSLPPPLYQVSRTVGLLEFGTDGIARFSKAGFTLSKKRAIIRCCKFKTNQKIPLFVSSWMRWGTWFENGLQTSHSCGFHS